MAIYRRERKPINFGSDPDTAKVKIYKIIYKEDPKRIEHFLYIYFEDGFYSFEVKFSKPLQDKTVNYELLKRDFSTKAKDYQFLRESTIDFLRKFGEFEVIPVIKKPE